MSVRKKQQPNELLKPQPNFSDFFIDEYFRNDVL